MRSMMSDVRRVLALGMGLFSLVLASACLAEPPASGDTAHSDESATLQIPAGHFVTLGFHDVRDSIPPGVARDPYAISTSRLAAWFDWMASHDWHPVSLDDIQAARSGQRALPANAVLLSFDDGLESFYSRVYPLLKAFDYPALFAVQTGWLQTVEQGGAVDTLGSASVNAQIDDDSVIHGTRDGEVEYNGRERGRSGFVTWAQIREMQASNLVEVASHTEDLHHGTLANPQGNVEPAVLARRFDPTSGTYESDAEYRRRIHDDLVQSADILEARTGKRPRALVWPYGATNAETEAIARRAGYDFTFSLNDQRISAPDEGPDFGRFLTMDDPDPVALESQIAQTIDPPRRIQRAVQVDLDYLYDADPAQVNANLGALLDRIKALGVRTVYLQAFADPDGDGTASQLYFPNDYLPMRADLFNRVAWQLSTRAGVDVYAWLPLLAFDLPDRKRQRQLAVRRNDGSEKGSIAERDYRRLSPFRPASQSIVNGIYADLARNTPSVKGVLIHDDAYLAADEDRQACSPAARWPNSDRPITDCALTPREKTRALIDFGEGAVASAERYVNRSNRFRVARNLYARVVLDPSAESRFSQALGPFLAHYDEVALMAMPYLDDAGMSREPGVAEAWLDRLVDRVMKTPDGLRKTVFELQPYDWQRERWIDPERFKGWMQQLVRRGALNLAYYPDDFIAEKPAFQPTFEGISLNEFPYLRSGAAVSLWESSSQSSSNPASSSTPPSEEQQ
ncbi:poly-beta-1,6-N-acetyl-D-glucosamine N-deacetylase PgaB [Salinicola rhizosphaerae]|uniref:Poly-beta-1,6-N-acetyl-D-glucosamine N-deacetylase PgaB n=1 Tax=Salinicola rhizosphaerae TaxID=1443141 RepID=A0ABQ3ECT5_9GAMM|nr:poly-beta-1,6-N-acetyl-D-glucosamine N-deacetylase PgaB [Salinicola rhizosphaerae]GHB33705.1 poly-beta-1,6-N-acetyl-D-glucosamine N-deacetylase PgaB [Salinicola rhizosphaerae]